MIHELPKEIYPLFSTCLPSLLCSVAGLRYLMYVLVCLTPLVLLVLSCLVLSLRCVCLLKLKSGDLDFHHHHGPSLPRATPVFFVWNRPACLLAYSAPSPPFYIDRSPFLPPIGLPPKFRLLIFDTFLPTAASKPISSSCVTLVHDFRRRHRPPLHSYLQTTNIIV